MLKQGALVYLQFAEHSPADELFPAFVLKGEGMQVSVALLLRQVPVLTGEAILHFKANNKLFEGHGRLLSVHRESSRVLVKLHRVDAQEERRQAFRIPVLGLGVTATLGSEADCSVFDLNETGMGVYAHKVHLSGTELAATVRYGTMFYAGRVSIRAVRGRNGNGFRYGTHVLESETTLRNGLYRIGAAVQQKLLSCIADLRDQLAELEANDRDKAHLTR